MNTPQHTWAESPIHEAIRDAGLDPVNRTTNDTPTPRTDYLLSDYVTVDQLIDHAREIETELTAAREALKTGGMLNIIDRAHHERAAAIRERDEARETLTSVTEQRDRLAEALKEYREALSDGPENCSYKMYEAVDEFAEQALQSLTSKP
jgi:hypothetical protein